MFCNQCEQTARGTGCDKLGVCGKQPDVAAVQDLINYSLRGLAIVALEAGKNGVDTHDAGRLCCKGLFSTITNVNFDKVALLLVLNDIVTLRDKLAARINFSSSLAVVTFKPAVGDALLEQAWLGSIQKLTENTDTNSLAQTLLFGLKGVSAYTDHAYVLGHESTELYESIFKLLAFGFDGNTPTLDEWVGAVLDCGKANLLAMELLDAANTGTYGHPEPTEVSLVPRPGKAILVTGHDLKDLYALLLQTEGKGINIYTHGEMLPTHAYPVLKKFPHFAGHYGTAWQNQQKELPLFPGAVLFTTNCIQKPAPEYFENVFTTGLVGWPGATHVKNGDFAAVIKRAEALEGFTGQSIKAVEDVLDKRGATRSVMVGFGRNTVLGVADTVIAGVKSGAIKHFILVGGCDGAKPGRNYYTELVEKSPKDTIILTLACGKFRFFDRNIGSIAGIPRLLDVGQCNDAYSAVKIALALAEAFDCSVNDLPLSLVLSWYEQKAVAVLLSLLYLGIKDIRLGPTLPAFITPAVLDVLVKNFDLKHISTAEADLQAILA